MDEESYRVNLDVYNGPLDLLLYLIRREEVDIYDIPIAKITDQYLQYVQLLKQIDPELAGEFMVTAATLMEIKTRLLLPTPPPETEGAEGLTVDPRAELVRQLLEYKTFKDAAGDLKDAAAIQAMKYPRSPVGPSSDEKQLDLEDAQVWDLLDAFSRMMTAIGADIKETHIIYDDTPVELHEADIIDRLGRDGSMSFEQIFAGRTSRSEIVGLFLALLELIRQRMILARQRANFDDIRIELNPDAPGVKGEAPQASEKQTTEDETPGERPPGQYVPQPQKRGGSNDDEETEDQPARI
ncbi:MAG: segregation/condensation protein A [Phycisphaerae bacterium]|nr:segregation/condensation protein A [Phycisphaerae bacterium]